MRFKSCTEVHALLCIVQALLDETVVLRKLPRFGYIRNGVDVHDVSQHVCTCNPTGLRGHRLDRYKSLARLCICGEHEFPDAGGVNAGQHLGTLGGDDELQLGESY